MGRLDGKIALVTGGTGGIGAAQAELLLAEGAQVVVTDLTDQERGDAVITQWDKAEQVAYHQLDVTSAQNWQEAIDFAAEKFGGLDILVNTAGDWTFAGIEECDLEEWNHLVTVNQTGTFLGMKAVIPEMKRRGSGSIINISSIWGDGALVGAVGYQASKGAVNMLTKNGAVTLAPFNIRVNAILPGIIRTEHLLNNPDGANDQTLSNTPLGRMGSPTDIAWGTVYLASDESQFVTGVLLPIDGGYLAP
jgi:NAD(P)-dependent dehydrogenase (short-subunit alcohol dehydrogenase family)